jgi:DNA-directed RNA polymerase II subunit RPB2
MATYEEGGAGFDQYEGDYDGYDAEYGYDDGSEGITPEDCWTVISSFFEAKGLVSQQIETYNEFTMKTIQDLTNEYSTISLDQPNPPSIDG